MKLQLEVRQQADKTPEICLPGGQTAVITPPIDEDYWLFRVKVSRYQAIVGFPKFSTIGVGFAKEKDWNTNLPYRCKPEEIWQHIKHNKGTRAATDEECIRAIEMVCAAAHQWRGTDPIKDAL